MENEELHCSNCGKVVSFDDKYCPSCGALLKQIYNVEESNESQEKEPIQAEYIPQTPPPIINKYIEIIKGLGSMILFLVIIVAIGFAIAFFLKGTVWAGIKVYPYLVKISQYLIPIVILIFIPLSFVKKLSELMALFLFISSYVFGLMLWIYAMLLILTFWGWVGFFISLFVTGGTVVPAAILAVIIHTKWIVLGQIAIGIALVFGTRFRAMYILEGY